MNAADDFTRVMALVTQTMDNLAALGVSESDARRSLKPLLQEAADQWMQRHQSRHAGANATKAEASRKRGIYQGLADIVLESRTSTRKMSKRETAREVQQLIIDAGYGEKSIETIRKNIKTPS